MDTHGDGDQNVDLMTMPVAGTLAWFDVCGPASVGEDIDYRLRVQAEDHFFDGRGSCTVTMNPVGRDSVPPIPHNLKGKSQKTADCTSRRVLLCLGVVMWLFRPVMDHQVCKISWICKTQMKAVLRRILDCLNCLPISQTTILCSRSPARLRQEVEKT
jgi:hypothetical protein